jgi:hypothetical protein
MWTFAFECDTKTQATKLKKWIQSDEIVNHINSILTDRNQYTISKEIIDSLPFYE